MSQRMIFLSLAVRDLATARAFSGSFPDPGGNVWQVLWRDQLHAVN